MTETELEYHFCFNCNDRKQCYTKPKDCTRIQEEIGLQEMTNEEYLKSCDTEQLAEAIYYLTWFHTELDERLDKNVKNGCYNDDENIKIVMEWLKQPHQ